MSFWLLHVHQPSSSFPLLVFLSSSRKLPSRCLNQPKGAKSAFYAPTGLLNIAPLYYLFYYKNILTINCVVFPYTTVTLCNPLKIEALFCITYLSISVSAVTPADSHITPFYAHYCVPIRYAKHPSALVITRFILCISLRHTLYYIESCQKIIIITVYCYALFSFLSVENAPAYITIPLSR